LKKKRNKRPLSDKQTNLDKPIGFYVWSFLGILGALIFLYTCIRPVRVIGFDSGWLPFLLDGTLQHKLGEVFLWVPFFFAGLFTYTKSQLELNQFIERWKYPMMLGGILNLISWFDLKDDVWWHPFCWVVLFWGIFGAWLCRKLFLPRASN